MVFVTSACGGGRKTFKHLRGAIHYHVFSQYTTMYYCNTLPCILAIRNHVLSQYTTMYHQSTQQCILAVHLCTKPPSFAMGKPRPRAKALCCNISRVFLCPTIFTAKCASYKILPTATCQNSGCRSHNHR